MSAKSSDDQQGHVAMETFPSGHRNLTGEEVDQLLEYHNSEHHRHGGMGWKTRAAVAELKARRAQVIATSRISVGPAWLVTTDRDARQSRVIAWAKSAFGEAQATGLAQRGLRLLEGAVEAFQAAGGDKAQGHKLIDYVFDRRPGELGQELGGVGVCVLALAAAAGLSADEEERREVERVTSRPAEEWAARNQAKNDAGFLAADAGDAPDTERLITAEEAATFVEDDPRPRHWTPRGWAWGPRLTPPGVDWEAVPQVSPDDHQRLVAILRTAEIGTNHDGTVLGMVRELVRQRALSRRQHGELTEAYAKLVATPPATDAEIGAGIKNNMLANELARIRLAVNRAAVLAFARKRLDTAHRGLAETWADEPRGIKIKVGDEVVYVSGESPMPVEAVDVAIANSRQRQGIKIDRVEVVPIAMRLPCPECGELHVDVKLVDHPHHTHACQFCGNVWRPAVVKTVGVQFLPGYKD